MGRVKIFITDDNEAVREALTNLLELQEGMEVVGESGDGQEALAEILTLSPDIVVMDIRMPGLSGTEITKILKKEAPAVKVIALTAEDHEAYSREVLEAGACEVLLKPCSADELVSAIRRCLSE